MPDALAGLAASAALAVSDIPFGGPISEVRVARIDGQVVINPPFAQLEKAAMDLMVAATYDNIMMVEGEMQEVSEQDLLSLIHIFHILYNITHDTVFLLNGYYIFGNTENFLPQIIL